MNSQTPVTMFISSPILLLHLILTILSFSNLFFLSSSAAAHHRHILHQPFFPLDSFPPTHSPDPSPPAPPPPDYPFTSSSPPDNPFFPESSLPPPSPPPPPPSSASFASFPANISSLIFPQAPRSPKRASSKLIAGAIAAVVAAIFVVSFATFLHCRKRKSRHLDDAKTHRSNSSLLHRAVSTNSSNGVIPKLQRPSQLSSEFLYLGTLVNAHGCIDNPHSNQLRNLSTNQAESSSTNPRKLGSPELRPLPPLNKQTFSQNFGDPELCSCGEDDYDEDDDFYSPKESRGNRDKSDRTESVPWNGFAVAKFGGPCSCSSCSSSSSASGSPLRSVSLSTSQESGLKSPDLISLQLTPPRRSGLSRILPTEPFPPKLIDRKESTSASASPTRLFSRSEDSSPRKSDSSDQTLNSPLKISSPDRLSGRIYGLSPSIPPTPPPPPPPLRSKQGEIPITPTSKFKTLVEEPRVLAAPERPMSVESPSLVPAVQLSSLSKDIDNNESGAKENLDDKVVENVENTKPKLKPLHWDKVRSSSERGMVWDQLKSSFKLNEEMIETLFVANAPKPTPRCANGFPVPSLPAEENRVLDPKKSQNIAILLRALHVTVDEVCEALVEGKAENLGTELLQNLLKMAPTKEEERKLKEHKDDSPIKLGPAEKFLKAVLEVPFAFRRLNTMLYISSFGSEIEYLKTSFETLEAASEELRNSRMFLKLLEAVLKTGNRMNVGTDRGDAHAFKLDTLLKLVDVKGADGKTTLLHFVVQEIIKSEGARICNGYQNNSSPVINDATCRKLGLQVVSALSSDLVNVKKAASMDSEVLNSDLSKLSSGLADFAEVARLVEASGLENIGNQKFSESINGFMIMAEEEIIKTQAQESVALSLVKEITEYFHGNSAKEEAHPLRIFTVVRDFLTILDRVCKEVALINERTTISSAHKFPVPVNPTLQSTPRGFPAKPLYSSSDDESLSN